MNDLLLWANKRVVKLVKLILFIEDLLKQNSHTYYITLPKCQYTTIVAKKEKNNEWYLFSKSSCISVTLFFESKNAIVKILTNRGFGVILHVLSAVNYFRFTFFNKQKVSLFSSLFWLEESRKLALKWWLCFRIWK